jgi:hypothetical protein
MCATAEAVIELLRLAYGKGGRFFVMEWTAGNKVGPGFLEWQVAFDHIHNVEAIEQVLNETFWNHSALAL